MATNYPASTDNGTSLPYPSATNDTNSPSLAGGQNNQNDAIIAVETLVGTNASQTTPTASGNVLQATSATASEWDLLTISNVASATGTGSFVFATSPTISEATLSSPTISNPTITGSLGGSGLITFANLSTGVLNIIHPVGCIYTETTGVNPATTLGFGTWVAFGAGRVLVGVGTSDEAFTAGSTGGESNHTLDINEMPSHTHSLSAATGTGGSFGSVPPSNGTITGGEAGIANTGGGAPHNNLQPYIVVYMWQRTV